MHWRTSSQRAHHGEEGEEAEVGGQHDGGRDDVGDEEETQDVSAPGSQADGRALREGAASGGSTGACEAARGSMVWQVVPRMPAGFRRALTRRDAHLEEQGDDPCHDEGLLADGLPGDLLHLHRQDGRECVLRRVGRRAHERHDHDDQHVLPRVAEGGDEVEEGQLRELRGRTGRLAWRRTRRARNHGMPRGQLRRGCVARVLAEQAKRHSPTGCRWGTRRERGSPTGRRGSWWER